ncbi:MAG: sodium:proton antiporter [Desulfobacterales bacterium PC51MH44]|jgi:multicomponent Na+:H+ antiporter subunit G|nr:MAG: sodium:proton antiporter [Desulfobacterales bacterium PC51MH44]
MEIVTIIFVVSGLFFFFAASIGLLRFPDFYARMHATGKGDTLGGFLIILGLAVYNLFYGGHSGFDLASILTSIKIVFIAVFIFLANPTATHAIAKAGLDAGVVPWTKEGSR